MRVYFQQGCSFSMRVPNRSRTTTWLRRIDHTEISVNRVLTPSRSFFRAGYFVRSMARKPHCCLGRSTPKVHEKREWINPCMRDRLDGVRKRRRSRCSLNKRNRAGQVATTMGVLTFLLGLYVSAGLHDTIHRRHQILRRRRLRNKSISA
jgi:hypothetical protein